MKSILEKDRSTLLSFVFVGLVTALVARLFYWQVIQGPELSRAASLQQTNTQTISAKRGKILASDGSLLVGTTPMWQLFLYRPHFEGSELDVVNKLAGLFGQEDTTNPVLATASESARLSSILSNKVMQWIPLKTKVNREEKSKIDELKINGLEYEEGEGRTYPEASMSAHLLGFVGKGENGENKGYFGLEGNYDLLLSGKSGLYESDANALGGALISDSELKLQSYEGADLLTSIQKPVQLMVEKRLQEGLAKYGSDAGSVTVMDPKTGEIIAMAAFPSFSPEKYYEGSDEFFRNPIISDSFEPGSIMKPIVMASAFDAGLVSPDTQCDICNGPYHVASYYIKTWNNQYFANSTMRDVIMHSDNVGMVFVGTKLGTTRLIDYFEKFGFGKLTGVDLQGEFGAPLRKRESWGEVERDTASFGQGIAVTPIQMVKAISVIANGGTSVSPHVVREIRLGDWKKKKEFPEETRVISEKASSLITDIMVNAVNNGEAKWAVPKAYSGMFAGKTGTAQVAMGGSYDEEKTNASFIGFAPANDPKFAMLVSLKEPKSSPWAAETAAPLWFQIGSDIMRFMGVPPKN